MRRINNCLNKQLLDLCQRVVQLDELNLKLAQCLPENLRDKCRAGSFNKGCLLLVASNPAFATELRYYLPTLRDRLRKDVGLYQLMSIKIQISLDNYAENTEKSVKKISKPLSESAQNSVRSAGELCTYLPLQKALYHLADNGKKIKLPEE